MDFKIFIGCKVSHKTFGAGEITDIDGVYVVVNFNGVAKNFQLEIFDKFFRFENEETHVLFTKMLQDMRDAKTAVEVARKAAEEAERKAEAERLAAEEAERLAQEEAKKKGKRNHPIHPYIDERRSNEKHAIFLVCQNNNFQIEADNGFIWAPTHIDKGEPEVASHAEMDLVKKGDIIFHHFANHIYAISVARADCSRQAAIAGHPAAGIVGRYVELSYHFLSVPADTSNLKSEKAAYGAMKYGPFDVHGNNKQGFYLSELHDHLATIFIDTAIAANPGDLTLLDIKKQI